MKAAFKVKSVKIRICAKTENYFKIFFEQSKAKLWPKYQRVGK